MGYAIANPSYLESLWVHSPPLGAKYQPGLAPWVHTFDFQLDHYQSVKLLRPTALSLRLIQHGSGHN
jgi:hypothetical protein